jgi:hypothetical protein
MLLGLRREPPADSGARQHRAIRVLDSAPVTVPAPLTALPAANIGGDETSDDGDLPTMEMTTLSLTMRIRKRKELQTASTRLMARLTTFLITPIYVKNRKFR